MDAWNVFCQTGRIEDYLRYRQTQDTALQETHNAVPPRKENKTHGNVSGAGSGRTDSRRPWEVY